MTEEFEIVKRDELPPITRQSIGAYARAYLRMQEIGPNEAISVVTKEKSYGAHFKRHLNRIASKEGMKIGWRRNKEGTRYFFWIDYSA